MTISQQCLDNTNNIWTIFQYFGSSFAIFGQHLYNMKSLFWTIIGPYLNKSLMIFRQYLSNIYTRSGQYKVSSLDNIRTISRQYLGNLKTILKILSEYYPDIVQILTKIVYLSVIYFIEKSHIFPKYHLNIGQIL